MSWRWISYFTLLLGLSGYVRSNDIKPKLLGQTSILLLGKDSGFEVSKEIKEIHAKSMFAPIK